MHPGMPDRRLDRERLHADSHAKELRDDRAHLGGQNDAVARRQGRRLSSPRFLLRSTYRLERRSVRSFKRLSRFG